MIEMRGDAAEIANLIPRGGRILVAGASGESPLLGEAVMNAGTAIDATFTGIFVPGLNVISYVPNAICRVEAFFMTPELARHPGQVDLLPICYQDILARLRTLRIDAAIMMLAPPDARGQCSFGPAVDFLAELWSSIPVRIAHINPLVPRTSGNSGIPVDALDAVVERATPLRGTADEQNDPVSARIARFVATLIPNDATLQTGLGKIPGAILRALSAHRGLRIHSGLIGDAVVDLEEAGALAGGAAVTAGVAIGTDRLYRAIGGPAYRFQPVSFTHDAAVIAAIPRFISINSALEVDLFGQAYAEVGPKGAMSGPGGASDFARAARLSDGGLRIVALPAEAARGTISRIISPDMARGPVSLGRFDIDVVVTEHGIADLRGLSHHARASTLIRIAALGHREPLERAWADISKRL